MNLLHVLWGFFVANILGYGGGPSSIPLMQVQIVHHYHWMNNTQFANVLALGNALPGPIATKIAAFVGYGASGWAGFFIAIAATVLPSCLGLIVLLKILNKYRTSSVVKGMTALVQPVIAILMVLLTWEIGRDAVHGIGVLQSVIIAAVALWVIHFKKWHPAFVIVAAFVYGGIVLPRFGV
ncbi:chromate transporter [Alicyclobacillus sp. SO9]|nr:chromate transporter [Alicyclobacillus sp. SO9]